MIVHRPTLERIKSSASLPPTIFALPEFQPLAAGMTKKRVVIVGGGFAGLRACRELRGGPFHVTLVDPKDCFEHVPAALRCMVEPESAKHNLVPYPANTPMYARHKQGIVVGISSDGKTGEVELQSGEKLPFDYALIATGSVYPGSVIKPNVSKLVSKASRMQEFQEAHDQITAASSIVIVGGGTVGVELAAEIVESWPGKKVVLVTSSDRILERMSDAVSKYSTEWLTAHGVELVCRERISDWGGLKDTPGPATLTTSSGRKLEGDWVIKAVGIKPASSAFAMALGADRLAPNGSILVEPTLQVKGMPNVFAAGDITSVAEEKTAYFADLCGMTAARNIAKLDEDQELQVYPEGLYGHSKLPFMGGLSLGKKDGVFDMVGIVQSGSSTARMRWLIEAITVRMATGSWLFGKLSNMMKSVVVSKLSAAANKEAAASKVAAVAVTAPATAS